MVSIVTDPINQAQLHRETYIAVLNGVLHARGSKRAFAEQIGITPQYLSYLLDPWNTRLPSDELAQILVMALPLPQIQQQQVLYHIAKARQYVHHACRATRRAVLTRAPCHLLDELNALQREAAFTQNPEESRVNYRQLHTQSHLVLQAINPLQDPMAYVGICILNHDVALVLNRPIAALWYAKQARAVIDAGLYDCYSPRDPMVMNHRINVLRAEGIAYHNLHLPKQAFACYTQAEVLLHTPTYQPCRDFWTPYLGWDIINVLARYPRFAITDAEVLRTRVLRVLDKHAHPEENKPLFRLLTHTALANAYISYGGRRSEKKAVKILNTELARFDTLPVIGPLHQVLLLKTYARLNWIQGDKDMWRHFIQRALRIALDAGLTHQLYEMKTTYGDAVAPVLAEVQLLPGVDE